MADCTEPHRLNEEQRDFGLLERQQTVAELYLKGKVQVLIAKEVGVTQQQVSNDLKAVRAAWLAAGIRDFDAVKSEQLAKLDVLEMTYWDAWERSKLDKERKITKRRSEPPKKDGKAVVLSDEAGIIREGQVGDPRFLEGVSGCIDKRCKLLGIYAPTKVDMKITDDRTPYEAAARLYFEKNPHATPQEALAYLRPVLANEGEITLADIDRVMASERVQ